MKPSLVEPPHRIIKKIQVQKKCKTYLLDFGGRFEIIQDDGQWALTLSLNYLFALCFENLNFFIGVMEFKPDTLLAWFKSRIVK